MTTPQIAPDTVVRALTKDGAFRVIAAVTHATVHGAIEAQSVRGTTAQKLGQLVTGSVLVREAMAPRFRVQIVLQGVTTKGSVVADSHPDGTNRGIVNLGGRRDIATAPGDLVQVLRHTPKGMHQGVVELPASGDISDALMAYMQSSEQVACVIATETLLAEDSSSRSCGYFVQLLPEAERGLLMVMTERLAAFPPLKALLTKEDLSAESLIEELLYAMPFTVTSTSEVRFGCHCSKERLLGSLGTLPQAEIASMIEDGKPLDIRCDGCNKEYVVTVEELLPLLPAGAGLFGKDDARGSA